MIKLNIKCLMGFLLQLDPQVLLDPGYCDIIFALPGFFFLLIDLHTSPRQEFIFRIYFF